VAFCDILVRHGHEEPKTLGFLLLGRFHGRFEKDLILVVESWLKEGACGNWAAVDGLCPWVITPLVRRHPDLIPRVRGWSDSRNVWLRRASAVTFVPLSRRGEHLSTAYRVARSLFGDDEDLIHKAVGWLLREAGRTDPVRLEAFLIRHGPRIPRTTVRYAIERYPEGRRRRILAATRGAPVGPRPFRTGDGS